MNRINLRVILKGKIYQLNIVVDAPKTEAKTILDMVTQALIKRGIIA